MRLFSYSNLDFRTLRRQTIRLTTAVLAVGCLLNVGVSHAERLKDLASIQGVRQNQLIGYGLAVGLDGAGDQTTQTPFTVQSVVTMLQ